MTSPLIINGNDVRDKLLADMKNTVQQLHAETGGVPGLAVILVGDDPASKAYVGSKKRACESLGIQSFEHRLAADTEQSVLLDLIHQLNGDSAVHGILLQLPLPDHLDADLILHEISPSKDVDGFHPENVGKLLQGLETYKSCTPYGIMKLLEFYDIDPAGQHVVIIGRSNIVGKPMAAMLVQKETGANATVTICHSRSKNMAEIARTADIVVAAIGRPNFVTADMVKEGAVVIDVGINRVDDSDTPKGYKLVGDVDFQSVASKTSAITPVPGGVGPMTIAMLMSNTIQSYKRSSRLS